MDGFDLRIIETSTGRGIIRLGNFQESIRVDVESAPIEWYEAQWQYTLTRLVESQIPAVLVLAASATEHGSPSVDVRAIEPSNDEWMPMQGFGEAWTFTVQEDGRVHVHNVLLFPELTVINGFDVVLASPDDDDELDDDDDDDLVPSEWIIDVVDVTAYLKRSGGVANANGADT